MKITAVEAIPVNITVNPDLAIVSAAGEHRISRYVIVAVRTGEGITGYGEANVVPVWSGETQAGAKAAIEDVLTPVLMGRDPLGISALLDAMDRALIGNPFTKAAVELALMDIAGKALGVPACTLLGGARRPAGIPLKFSIGAFAPRDAARVAEHAASIGLKAVKVKVGTDLARDVERVEAVRSELGADFAVGVDANGGWNEAEAVAAIPHLERLGVNAFEQPLRRGEFRGCARLRQRTRIPIMLDESIFTREDALEAIRCDACDLISIYPGKNGGMWRSLEIAQLAAAAGLECIIGSNLEWDLGTAAMLHVAVAAPGLSRSVNHDIIGPLYQDPRIVTAPVRFEGGCAILPQGSGLGVEPDLAILQEYAAAP